MLKKIKNRLASEQGFTLIELLVVIVILGILAAIAIPSYLSFRDKAQTAAAEANVRSAIPAAEGYYQNQDPNSYKDLDSAALTAQAPGVSPHVKVGVSTDFAAYCLEDTEAGATYSYLGGNASAAGVTLGTNKAATIEPGTCADDTGLTAS